MKSVVKAIVLFFLFSVIVNCQENGYRFVMLKEVPSTPVKNQSATSTCWSFSGLSFFESELMRMNKGQYDLSEMFIVKEAYKKKAAEYLKVNGNCAFSSGGQYYDLLMISREEGLVPDMVYPGLKNGQLYHNHDEMDSALKGYIQGVLKGRRNTPSWMDGLNGILEAYLGKMDDGFTYKNKYYTPKSFAGELGLNFNDYIVLSSFTDHPYYKESILEVPDNWAPCTYYNIPLKDLTEIIDNSLMSGYSVAWACDMRGKGFSMKKGVAVVPSKDWNEITDSEYDEILTRPHPQKMVNEDVRQHEFEGCAITGDHGMHIIGMAQDQDGEIFYKVKNSWGATGKYDGYIFVSKEYLKLKTTNIMINKNALPGAIAQKLGFINEMPANAIAEGSSKADDQKPEDASLIAPEKPSR
ncbi:MAG TPA: C1 family peptidase [Bacteroidales bacterium]|nr:C1 family peptidase [Bacteroidales bacterium]